MQTYSANNAEIFKYFERNNRPSEMFWPEKTETSCVKKVIEPLGKSDKRLQAASDLPKKCRASGLPSGVR